MRTVSRPIVTQKQVRRCHFCREADDAVLAWDDARGTLMAHFDCIATHSHMCPPRQHRCVLRFAPGRPVVG